MSFSVRRSLDARREPALSESILLTTTQADPARSTGVWMSDAFLNARLRGRRVECFNFSSQAATVHTSSRQSSLQTDNKSDNSGYTRGMDFSAEMEPRAHYRLLDLSTCYQQTRPCRDTRGHSGMRLLRLL